MYKQFCAFISINISIISGLEWNKRNNFVLIRTPVPCIHHRYTQQCFSPFSLHDGEFKFLCKEVSKFYPKIILVLEYLHNST